ncbi:hypothetical protein CIPAW_01G225600 [Carya illinoinensis]|uniref:Uncharacterized protein n=1 Tax=Carya illinoinensis TaxID=32201 RepID=A0A8T1RRH8_CARIL|nr:hypothetical protein CIPAW_01G225600 [Carya illinoinensis]
MSYEAPKLYANKPKKEQQQKAHKFSSPSSSSSSMGLQSSVPPPQQPPKESLARRYKFLWPMLLAVNLAVGAYVFMSTKKKDTGVVEEIAIPASTNAATTAPVAEKPLPLPTIIESVKSRKPVPQDQQRELFKWLLEEKRKVKSKDPDEKKRIDEEKAILKRFIQAKSIPSV